MRPSCFTTKEKKGGGQLNVNPAQTGVASTFSNINIKVLKWLTNAL